MKPCNNNSECVYFKRNNTFYCRCLNGAASCDENANLINKDKYNKQVFATTNGAYAEAETTTTTTVAVFINNLLSTSKEVYRIAKAESKLNSEIPKFGFNYENLYILLPVGLVGFIIIVFITMVVYVGVKARSRTARFNKETPTIRNIHYITDANAFIENIKPLPNLSNSTLGYISSERDYNENYGRV